MDEAREIQRLLTQVQDHQLAHQAHALDVETRADPPPRPSPTKSVKSARVHDDDVSIKSWNQSDYSEDVRCARETHEPPRAPPSLPLSLSLPRARARPPFARRRDPAPLFALASRDATRGPSPARLEAPRAPLRARFRRPLAF